MIFGRNKSGNLVGGCLANFLCFAVVLFLVSAVVRGCNGPYGRAMRARTSNPCEAARLFAVDIREDTRGNSVFELGKLDSPCAMREIVELMDLPDGRYVGATSRQWLWESLQRQARKVAEPIPPYDPSAVLKIRKSQQAEWRSWLNAHHIGP